VAMWRRIVGACMRDPDKAKISWASTTRSDFRIFHRGPAIWSGAPTFMTIGWLSLPPSEARDRPA